MFHINEYDLSLLWIYIASYNQLIFYNWMERLYICVFNVIIKNVVFKLFFGNLVGNRTYENRLNSFLYNNVYIKFINRLLT